MRWSSPFDRPHPDVQICIMNSRMINLVAGEKHRWELAGDNLFVDLDLSRENLQAGQLLSIGECVIEITEQSHNGCSKCRRCSCWGFDHETVIFYGSLKLTYNTDQTENR